ncbi:hypothetical protein JST97_20415 [bacterium]|nr:hypothetical protein [bacterium]
MVDLEALLAREAGIGTYDSTGVFTISLAEARRKLQQFQLSGLEQAVLKLIQAAVQLEPLAIWMESDEKGFRIYWAEPKVELEVEQIARDFERTLLGPDCPAKDAAIGLMGFLDKEPAQIWWAQWSGSEVVETVNLFGGQKQAQLHQPPAVHLRTCALVIRAGARWNLDRQAIATRTIFCPVLLLWNGRLMCELSWNPPGWTQGRAAYWADFYLPCEGPVSRGIALKPIGNCRKRCTDLSGFEGGDFNTASSRNPSVVRRYVLGEARQALTLSGRKPQVGLLSGGLLSPANLSGVAVKMTTSLGKAIWVVSGAQEERALLLCVKHGVLMDPCTLPRQLGGMVAVVATPDLEMDLSQFRPIVGSPSWKELAPQVQAQAQQVVAELMKDPPTSRSESDTALPAECLAAGLVAGVVAAVSLPVPMLLGGALGCLGGFFGSQKLSDWRYSSRLTALERAVRGDQA